MARFPQLPVELVEHILAYCRQSELYSLIRVSKAHYTLAVPYLYEHVDLRIRANKVPRIDTFYLSVSGSSERGKRVKTLRLGLSPDKGVKDGQHALPKTSEARQKQFDQAVEMLFAVHPWIGMNTNLQEAMHCRWYGAFACLLLLSLPNLSIRRLELSDHENETLAPLPKILDAITHGVMGITVSESTPLMEHLSSIEEIVQSFDNDTGIGHPGRLCRVLLSAVYRLPGLRKLEFFVPSSEFTYLLPPPRILARRRHLHAPGSITPTLITNVTIRHTEYSFRWLEEILKATPHLVSLTCDIWNVRSELWVESFNSGLRLVKDTLQTLTVSVEDCDPANEFYDQPERNGSRPLDLSDFSRLHTLEIPVPLITGDDGFSIVNLNTKGNIARNLPPNLRHLSLRTDMSKAQFIYPTKKTEELTFEKSSEEAHYLMGAKMDLSSIFQTTLLLLDHAVGLQSITVWQPPDPSLNWFEGHLKDLETTCRNKMILGRMIYPQIIRLRHQKHWNLVKEMTLFDPAMPDRGRSEQYARGERTGGVLLGLATQYHLSRFLDGQVESIY